MAKVTKCYNELIFKNKIKLICSFSLAIAETILVCHTDLVIETYPCVVTCQYCDRPCQTLISISDFQITLLCFTKKPLLPIDVTTSHFIVEAWILTLFSVFSFAMIEHNRITGNSNTRRNFSGDFVILE